jgi:hypothetical protein
MRFIFLLLFAFLLLFCTHSESPKKIRSITTLTYTITYKNGKYVRANSPKEVTYNYDSLVNLLEVVEYGTTKYRYKFNNQGEKIEMSVFSSNDFFMYKETYRYNDIGMEVEKNKKTKTDKLLEKLTYYYNKSQHKIQENLYDADDNLKGTLKYVYNTKNEVIEDTLYSKNNLLYEYAYVYNGRKNAIEKSIYVDGDLDTKNTYSYDERGNILEESIYKIDTEAEKITLQRTISFKYDNNGNKIEMKTLDPDGKSWITSYQYDRKAILVGEIEFNSDNSLARKIFYRYDNENRKLEEKCLKANGAKWWSSKYKYQSNNGYEKVSFDENGKMENRHIYVRDSSGKMLKSTLLEPGGNLHWEISYLYNDSGKLIKLVEYNPIGRDLVFSDDEPDYGLDYSGNGDFTVVTLFDYDNNGNKIKADIFYERTLITGYNYSGYDKLGNWTERTSFYRKAPIEITERKIKYF